ncbi:hypothetical protein ANN_10748 [Periplaneta americana]|uniref:Reverse transcriptase domain-containing protein n=1 Tax=Periplaneta americana TaxID=6978 RepID=A0ABQ8T4B4_PERAM|nr:hypothetical protein ANN_10748 [Periplaneta americana]
MDSDCTVSVGDANQETRKKVEPPARHTAGSTSGNATKVFKPGQSGSFSSVSPCKTSPVSIYAHLMDVKEFGEGKGNDFRNAVFPRGHHLEMVKWWFGQECNMGGVTVGGRRIKCIRFADDMALFAEEEMILRDRPMLLELNDSCEQYGMKVNANKTKTMVIGRKIKKEEEKELFGPLTEKKLRTEGCTGKNDEREESSVWKKVSNVRRH